MVDASKEAEFFDKFATHHHDYDVLGEGAYRRLVGLLAALVRPRSGERCIDLGCGTGVFTRRLRPFSLVLTGLDISSASVARGNARAAGENYIVGDIRRTGLADGSFEIVVFSGVLHHLRTRETRLQALTEAWRILRPAGRLFAYDPSAHSPSMRLYRDPRSPLYSSRGKTENEVLLDRGELAEDLRSSGFTEIAVRGVGGITFRYVDSPLARVFLPLYNLYELALRLSPFEDRWGTFLVSFARRPG